MVSQDILIVDDEIGIRELLSEILLDEGYTVATAENAEAARRYRNQAEPKLVLLDIWMPDTDGVTLLKEWTRQGQLTMPVIMMSGHATIDTAVEATRIGALDFLEKPIGLQKLLATVKRGLSTPVKVIAPTQGLSQLGNAQIVCDLQETLSRVAPLSAPVLLTGQPGSGFEACARFFQKTGTPFVVPTSHDDLALAPQELLNKASGGVLFLRDISYMEQRAQQGLLSMLPKLEKSRVRLVVTITRPLNELTGQMDPELLRQISQIIVPVPALADHPEDIPGLATLLLEQVCETSQLPARQFSQAALQLLARQSWPGNLEQLANVVKSLALTCRDHEIDPGAVSRLLTQLATHQSDDRRGFKMHEIARDIHLDLDLPLREARDQFERVYLERQIELSGGNMSRVAERIGLERTHLYRKLKQLGIQMPKKGRAAAEE